MSARVGIFDVRSIEQAKVKFTKPKCGPEPVNEAYSGAFLPPPPDVLFVCLATKYAPGKFDIDISHYFIDEWSVLF